MVANSTLIWLPTLNFKIFIYLQAQTKQNKAPKEGKSVSNKGGGLEISMLKSGFIQTQGEPIHSFNPFIFPNSNMSKKNMHSTHRKKN